LLTARRGVLLVAHHEGAHRTVAQHSVDYRYSRQGSGEQRLVLGGDGMSEPCRFTLEPYRVARIVLPQRQRPHRLVERDGTGAVRHGLRTVVVIEAEVRHFLPQAFLVFVERGEVRRLYRILMVAGLGHLLAEGP